MLPVVGVTFGQHAAFPSRYSWPLQPEFVTYLSFPNSSRYWVSTGPIYWLKFSDQISSPRKTNQPASHSTGALDHVAMVQDCMTI